MIGMSQEGAMQPWVVETIPCVECGATAHLLPRFSPDDPPRPGDIVAYRCEECMDRFDVVVDDVGMEDRPEYGT
jgi:hypothetical protein